MRSTIPMSRAAIAGVLLVSLVAMSGCSWLRKDNSLYTADSRPLEVPPDLEVKGASAAADAPAGPVTASGTVDAARAGSNANTGFKMAEGSDGAYARIDAALSGIEGVTIVNRAKVLGAFDVNYRDANFLIRVTDSEGGSYVSAVDPRGTPANDEAAVQLVTALKSAIGGQ